MNPINFKKMDYDELRYFIEAASAEFAERRSDMRREAWNAVEQAISNYTEEFGDIIIDHGEYYIPDACDFSITGMIMTYEEEKEDEEEY